MGENLGISQPAVTTRDKLSDILYTLRSFDQGGYRAENIHGIGALKLKDIEGNISHRKDPFDRKLIIKAKEIAKRTLAEQTEIKGKDSQNRKLEQDLRSLTINSKC